MSDKTVRVYQIAVFAVLGDKGPAEAAGPFLLPGSERMQVLAHHDKLTGLPSRIGLDGVFPNARKLIVEKNRQIAVWYLDLDGFKGINDNLGHHMGDLLLKEAANQLTGCIRSDAFAARIGGDEFVVAIPLSREEALEVPTAIANRINSIINQVFEVEGHCMKVDCRVGCSFWKDADKDYKKLLIRLTRRCSCALRRFLYRLTGAGYFLS